MNHQTNANPSQEPQKIELAAQPDNFARVFVLAMAIILLFAIVIFKSHLEKPWQRWQAFRAVEAGQIAEVKEFLANFPESREDLINVAIIHGKLAILNYLLTTGPSPDHEKTRLMMEKAIESFRPEVLKLWLKKWAKDRDDAEKWAGSMIYNAAAGGIGYPSAHDELERRNNVIKQLMEINALSELSEEDRQKIIAECRFHQIRTRFQEHAGKNDE